MAMDLVDNLNYQGRKPDFVRQEYSTVADMAAVKSSKMPEMYIAYCTETHKVYLYNKQNTEDLTYGKWREFGSGDGADIQVDTMPEAEFSELGNVYQYIGTTTLEYTQGCFYICRVAEGTYFWENLPTGTVSKITIAEIDELFEGL